MSRKRKAPRKASGGRYTPPGTRPTAPPRGRRQPPSITGLRQLAESEPFEVTMRRQSRALRARCDALLDEPTTEEEWQDADLEQMDGSDAPDELLIAYWKAHRRTAELGEWDEPPDLAQVRGWLEAGIDPVVAIEARYNNDE